MNKFVINEPRLKSLLDKTSDIIMPKVCEQLKGAAKNLCPVDTGALQASIDWEKRDETYYIVYADKDYAAYVELGTPNQSAQSYLAASIYQVAGQNG